MVLLLGNLEKISLEGPGLLGVAKPLGRLGDCGSHRRDHSLGDVIGGFERLPEILKSRTRVLACTRNFIHWIICE